jgi:hypothetical protein
MNVFLIFKKIILASYWIIFLCISPIVQASWQGGYDIPKIFTLKNKKTLFNPNDVIKVDHSVIQSVLVLPNSPTSWTKCIYAYNDTRGN